MTKNDFKKFSSVDVEFQDITFTVFYTYSPGTEGRYWGRPEDCYEGEPPEVDVEALFVENTDVTFLLNYDKFSDEIYEIIYDEVCATEDSNAKDDKYAFYFD